MTHALQLLRHPLVGGHDFIECIGNFSLDPEMVAGHPHGKISAPHRLKRVKQVLRGVGLSVAKGFAFCGAASGRWRGRTEIAHEFPLGNVLESEQFVS
ncbi:MAG TPA: hypothetical protein VGP39_04895 [Bradyrhizobium sp.]|nr:hypothetical protein [Bradyrhizobium sp.]